MLPKPPGGALAAATQSAAQPRFESERAHVGKPLRISCTASRSELSKATERIAELHAAGQAEEDQFKSECSMYLLASIAGASPTAAQRKSILDYLKSMTDDGGSYSLDNGSMSFAAIAAMMRSLHGLERSRLAFLGGIIPKILSMITDYYFFSGDDEQEWREQALSLCVSLLAKIAGVRTNVTLKPPSAA